MENLTDLERAAICFHVFGGCKDKFMLFKIAEGETRYNKLKENSRKTIVYNWFASHKIQTGISFYETVKEHEKQESIKNYLKENETENENRIKEFSENEKTNFLDRDEFLKFLNDRANKIKDDKLRNDILKMLSDNLRYKDSDNNEVQETQRFYTPMNCEICEIYNKCKSCRLSECVKVEK